MPTMAAFEIPRWNVYYEYGSNIIKFFIYPTECTTGLKLTLKFTLKCSYMFRLTNRYQGAYCRALLKL